MLELLARYQVEAVREAYTLPGLLSEFQVEFTAGRAKRSPSDVEGRESAGYF